MMRRFLNVLTVLGMLAIGYYGLVAPRIALAGIERAAAADDVVALAYHLDLVSIRRGLQADLATVASAPGASGVSPLEQMANSLGQALGGAVAEVVASPEGVLQLLGGVPLRSLLGGAIGRNRVAETFARATTGYEWPLALAMRVPAQSDGDAIVFVLRPRGWVWKIVEVRLLRGE